VRVGRSDDAGSIDDHREIGAEMTRSTHFIARRAAEGVAFYTVALGALTVWAQYWGVRKQRSRQA